MAPQLRPREWSQATQYDSDAMIIVTIVCGVLSVTVVSVRLWLRVIVQRNADMSDWFALVALVATVATLVLACVSTAGYNVGGSFYQDGWNNKLAIQTLLAASALISAAECFVRFSIIMLYLRIVSSHSNRSFRIICWIVFALSLVPFVLGVIGVLTICQPLNALWDISVPGWAETHRFSFSTVSPQLLFAAPVVNVALDIITSIMPVGVLWRMQLPLRQKIAIWILFSVGFVASAGGAMRLYYGVLTFFKQVDQEANICRLLLWFAIECSIALISTSLPTLKFLFGRFFDDVRAASFRAKAASGHSTGGNSSSNGCCHSTTTTSSSSGARTRCDGDGDILLEDILCECEDLGKDGESVVGGGCGKTARCSGNGAAVGRRGVVGKDLARVMTVEKRGWSAAEEAEMGKLFNAAGKMIQ